MSDSEIGGGECSGIVSDTEKSSRRSVIYSGEKYGKTFSLNSVYTWDHWGITFCKQCLDALLSSF